MENPTVVCIGIVQNSSGQVLIIERQKKETGSNGAVLSWAFPGGIPENHETREQAVQRELLEETGYEVLVQSFISSRDHPQFPVKIYYYACTPVSEENREIIADDEVKQIKWVNPLDLRNYFTTDLALEVAKHLKI